MSAAAALRVGWCPGALRPMQSRDGLIVRIKPRGGMLTPRQGIGIAAAATRFGNGALDLTSRANLQVRGVGEAALPELTAALDRLGLLDASPEAEARRNVVVSPLAGLDPAAAFDVRPAVAALETRLATDPSLAGLPAKFGVAVSHGGRLPLAGVPADLRFEAESDGAGRPVFAIRLDGDDGATAICAASDMPETAVRIARAFVVAAHGSPELHRMRDLVARDGAAAVFGDGGLAIELRSGRDRGDGPVVAGLIPDCVVIASTGTRSGSSEGPGGWPRRAVSRGRGYGAVGSEGKRLVLGVAAAFGRLDGAQLDVLARAAASAGVSELRLTPWRAILAPGLDPPSAVGLARACAAVGLIVDPADPRLRIAACPGAPGCGRGTTPTLDHAALWARFVGPGRGIALHVAGCAKGCAHAKDAPLTLVARDGCYDAVVDGRAGDAPAVVGLAPEAIRRLIPTAPCRGERS